MNIENTLLSQENIDLISRDIRLIEEMISSLEEAARLDMEPKAERLRIMEEALLRDVNEVNKDAGADRETAEQLYHQLNKEAHSLKTKLGGPTKVSTEADALFRGVDKVVEIVSGVKAEMKDAYQEGLDSTKDES
jgi:hypothetical protein